MLATPLQYADDVPARSLFPKWRGDEPFDHRLAPARLKLLKEHPGLGDAVRALPFHKFETAHRRTRSVESYHDTPAAARAMVERLPEEVRAPWLCALMLNLMAMFDATFTMTGLPTEFALHYADSFHRIIDQIDADTAFADLDRDSFMKDLWLTRVVMIPAFAQLWWPRAGLSARAILKAGLQPSLYVFGRCGGRRPFLEGHTHDPIAKAYWNEPGWRQALRLAAMALPALPEVKGVFGTAWFYDPAIRGISPRISFAQDLQVGRGACRFEIGSDPAAIANATATSAERRNRYKEGSYLPTDYAIIWSRRDLIAAYGN
jgi:hypothetical protein